MSHISGSKMRIQEWFSPLERAHNLFKISHFLLRSPNLVLGHNCARKRVDFFGLGCHNVEMTITHHCHVCPSNSIFK